MDDHHFGCQKESLEAKNFGVMFFFCRNFLCTLLNNEILSDFLLVKQEGKKFQCKGYKTLLLKKKGTKVTTFSRKEIRHCGHRKENTVQIGIKKKDLFLEISPNLPHFEERNFEATKFRQ